MAAATGGQESAAGKPSFGQHVQARLVAGILTLIPIVVTYIAVSFALRALSDIGEPAVRALASLLSGVTPVAAAWVVKPVFINAVSVLIVVIGIYMIGWLASHFLGARLIGFFDGLINRIPLVKQVYGSIKALLNVLQQRPDQVQRVVMIEFPHQDMKTIGFVTRTMRDEATGRELAAVFVPTTPNPTGGYLEVVPIDRLVSTDWTIDEAMNFVISGGAIAPDRIAFSKSAASLDPSTAESDSTRSPAPPHE